MLKILYEDTDILVVDKPPGLVVTEIRLGEPAHRLDKDTSGVLLVAKHKKALENLQHQFKTRLVKKEYLALVHGQVMEGGRVDAAILRNPQKREKFTVVPPGRSPFGHLPGVTKLLPGGGKEAETEYEPLERLQVTPQHGSGQAGDRLQGIFSEFNKIQMRKLERQRYGEFTLVKCFPKTGRTHQIRVHLKYIQHPVVADDKYVGRRWVRLDKRWCPRMFLHAAKIGFKHPVTGKWMEVESPLPKDLKEALWTTFLYNWP